MYAGSFEKDKKKRNIFENFKSYGLDKPELVSVTYL